MQLLAVVTYPSTGAPALPLFSSLLSPTPVPFTASPLIMDPCLGGLNCLGQPSLLRNHPLLSTNYALDMVFHGSSHESLTATPQSSRSSIIPVSVDVETEVPKG